MFLFWKLTFSLLNIPAIAGIEIVHATNALTRATGAEYGDGAVHVLIGATRVRQCVRARFIRYVVRLAFATIPKPAGQANASV